MGKSAKEGVDVVDAVDELICVDGHSPTHNLDLDSTQPMHKYIYIYIYIKSTQLRMTIV